MSKSSAFVHRQNHAAEIAGLADSQYNVLGYKLNGEKFDETVHSSFQYAIWGGVGLVVMAALYGG